MTPGWNYKQLGDVCENLDSKRVPITKSKRLNGAIPYYGASGVVDHVADYLFDEDLLLVSEDGANLLARTYPIAFSISGKTWVNNHAHVLRFEDIDSQRFIGYYFNSISLEPYLSGMAQPKLNQKSLNSITVPYPPLPEQKRIVAILDEAFAAIDAAVANTEKNLANARELFESYLNGVFTRKGDGWVEKAVVEIAEVVSGHSFKSGDFSEKNNIKSIKITNVGVRKFVPEANNYLPSDFASTYKKFQIEEGSIVIALTRSIISTGLKVAVVPSEYDGALLNQRVAALKVESDKILQQFLFSYLCTQKVVDFVKKQANTLMQPNLSITDLKNLLVPVPPIAEQQQIVEKIDALSSDTQRLETIYQQKLTALAELKQSILQKAFAGELTAQPEITVAEAVA